MWWHSFLCGGREVASATAAIVKCMQWARVWVQLQFTRQKGERSSVSLRGRLWHGRCCHAWSGACQNKTDEQTYWDQIQLPHCEYCLKSWNLVPDRTTFVRWLDGWKEWKKKMVGRVFQSIKRRHARQVTHSSPKINVCAWSGPRKVNHMLNIL